MVSTVMTPSSSTLAVRWTFADEYWPALLLCVNHARFTTSMEPAGRAELSSFSNRVSKASLNVHAGFNELSTDTNHWLARISNEVDSKSHVRSACRCALFDKVKIGVFPGILNNTAGITECIRKNGSSGVCVGVGPWSGLRVIGVRGVGG